MAVDKGVDKFYMFNIQAIIPELFRGLKPSIGVLRYFFDKKNPFSFEKGI